MSSSGEFGSVAQPATRVGRSTRARAAMFFIMVLEETHAGLSQTLQRYCKCPRSLARSRAEGVDVDERWREQSNKDPTLDHRQRQGAGGPEVWAKTSDGE